MRAPLLQRNVKLVSLVLTGLYESQQDIKAGYNYWKERVKQSPDDADVVKAAEDYRKALPKFRKRIKALEELQKALKLEAKDAARIDAWMNAESYEWHFDSAKFNMPLYEMHGHVGPDGFVVWDE